MPPHRWTRLPLPHLFMTGSVGAFALMALAAVGPEDSFRTIASFLAFLTLLIATVRVARAADPGRGRPVLVLVAGLSTGAAGAASLFSIGGISASSPLWVYLPLVFATLATTIGGSASQRVAEGSAVTPLTATTKDARCARIRARSRLASELSTGS